MPTLTQSRRAPSRRTAAAAAVITSVALSGALTGCDFDVSTVQATAPAGPAAPAGKTGQAVPRTGLTSFIEALGPALRQEARRRLPGRGAAEPKPVQPVTAPPSASPGVPTTPVAPTTPSTPAAPAPGPVAPTPSVFPQPTASPGTPPLTTAPDVCPPSKAWKLDLNDTFDTFNSKVWNVKNDTYASNEDSYLRAQNVTLSGGTLRVQAKKETYKGRHYTSGYVETIGKYTLPTHFRAEVRAKLPMEQGMWPAPLWLRPADGKAGEIDLVETYGKDAVSGKAAFHHTIHTEYGSTHQQKVTSKRFSDHVRPSATDWHTYTVEKTAGKIVMFVDCVKTAEFTTASPSWYSQYYDAGDRWNLRVNLQVGGTWGGLPDGRTDWSPGRTAMEIDHIKTWLPAS